jgi:transcriptional regulator with XRE-family HTH domain
MPKAKECAEEEVDFLSQIYNAPALEDNWRIHAQKLGCPTRSMASLRSKIGQLQRAGKLGARNKPNPESGWLTLRQLAMCLGVSIQTVQGWLNTRGLPYQHNNNAVAQGGSFKISMKAFVKWAVETELGRASIVKACFGNRLALEWVFKQISVWSQVDD